MQNNSTEAWRIIDALAKNNEHQEKFVDLKRNLTETEAGKTLYNSLQKLLVDQKDSLKSLLTQA
jgi:GrpB-like predicted nucleotidyltransferase (UPF0157 family)